MTSDGAMRVSVTIGAQRQEEGTGGIALDAGRRAKQASGAGVVRQGETMVLATAVAGAVRDVDFLPLTVDVEERMYATGKIPGSFFKREGRPGEKATLTARMIDRPLRPLFPRDWRYDTQLVAIPLSIDHVHPYDILAMNGASAAVMISDIPFPSPVGAVRIGKVDGNFVVNPKEEDLITDFGGVGDTAESRSDLDLVVAGTEDAILMVEAGANEIPEAEILDALDIAHAEIKKLCALQRELAAKVGREKKQFESIGVDESLVEEIRAGHGAALGTLKEEMRLDTLGLETKKYYWHHYNFPPFSVGEAGRMGGVKRRDIGHGALAERALTPMVPSIEEFPYSIRVVSDILESNGSSSMASVCGSSLSLMDAGVPIQRPVAGIAMGLIKEGDDYVVLTDIAGVEDHLGDMDFKVAGTERGITALQMDIKISGVTFEILRDALTRAHSARKFILGKMADVIGSPREQLSQFAPRIQTIQRSEERRVGKEWN